jgi:hypothetical protein
LPDLPALYFGLVILLMNKDIHLIAQGGTVIAESRLATST